MSDDKLRRSKLTVSEAQQNDIYQESRNHAVNFLQNSLSDLHEWEFISEKKSVQFFRKKSSDGTVYTINGITRICADLDETMRTLYCEDSTSFCNLMSQMHDEKFNDGYVLSEFETKRDPTGICREQASLKGMSFKAFNSMDKPRHYHIVDYCTIRTGKSEDIDDNGGDNRLGIQLFYSTDLREFDQFPFQKQDSVSERSSLYPSGFIVYPTAKRGVLEVIFSLSALNTSQGGVPRGYKKTILNMVSAVSKLENIFLAIRISNSGFIKSKNWVNDKDRAYCFICRESFGAFRRRHHCRLCGDITCSKCSSITAVKLPVIGLSQVRICNRCLKDKDSSRTVKSSMNGATGSSGLRSNTHSIDFSDTSSQNSTFPPTAPSAQSNGPPNPNSSSFSLSSSTTSTLRGNFSMSSSSMTSHDADGLQVLERISQGMSTLSAVPSGNCIDSEESENEGESNASSSSSFRNGNSGTGYGGLTRSISGSSAVVYNNGSQPAKSMMSESFDEVEEISLVANLHGDKSNASHSNTLGSGQENTLAYAKSRHPIRLQAFHYELQYASYQAWPLGPIPNDEAPRLRKLDSLRILDTPIEQEFNHIAQNAAEIFNASMGFVSFIDAKREWIKAYYNAMTNQIASANIPRDVSISAHAIMSYEVTAVMNLSLDVRFKDNPFVQNPKTGIKFFVGFPLVTSDGFVVGVLSVADISVQKEPVTIGQIASLKKLANHVNRLLEERAHYSNNLSTPTPAQPQHAQMANMQNTLLNLLQKTQQTDEELKRTQSMMNQTKFQF